MNKILELLKSETVEVIGCTEPAAIAYSFALVKKFFPETKISIKNVKARLTASKEILRNADTAGIPRLNARGLKAVSAMGIFSENPQFNIFSKITKMQLANVKEILARRNWFEFKVLNKNSFYIKSELMIGDTIFESIIQDKHNNLISFKKNGKIIFQEKPFKQITLKGIQEIYDISEMRDNEIEKFAESILNTNGSLYDKLKIFDVSEAVAQLIEQRMSGAFLSICTFTGSGNQGIFLSLPFYKLYKQFGRNVLPAFVFTLLMQIYLKQQSGLLSHLCGLSEKASPALAAGFLFLKNRKLSEIEKAIISILETTRGLCCEGAKESCADKGFMCMHNVIRKYGQGMNL
ncbi:MAG TPA: L-serine ammonia-lyase, iron-sulfur-dependent, subunit alpha [bacterium]|nr:L-serine ammonia-lyase, iron-sulfur-dependent, subunit alpha [bacterium]